MSALIPFTHASAPAVQDAAREESCFFCEEERGWLRRWRAQYAQMLLAHPTDPTLSRMEARIAALELSLLRHECERPGASAPPEAASGLGQQPVESLVIVSARREQPECEQQSKCAHREH